MSYRKFCPVLHALGAVATLAFPAAGQLMDARFDRPSMDKWMYPFGPPGGRESNAPIFAAILQAGFDDRDAQFLVGYSTAATVAPALGHDSYRIARAVVRATVSTDRIFEYDPTWDSYRGVPCPPPTPATSPIRTWADPSRSSPAGSATGSAPRRSRRDLPSAAPP